MPLSNNFIYEWIQNDKVISHRPQPGEVLLFNNMLPHRFVSDAKEFREVIYLDMFDPLTEEILNTVRGNYSEYNAALDAKYK